MRRALEQSNQLIEQANAQAQAIVDNATTDANGIRKPLSATLTKC